MEKSHSGEADSRLANQEIPHLLWKPKVHYCVRKRSLLDSTLNQMHEVHTFIRYYFTTRFNIILTSTFKSLKLSLSFIFSTKICTHFSRPPNVIYGIESSKYKIKHMRV
jgi:hypothetical protein